MKKTTPKINTDMFYCHQCDKVMMEDPYRDLCMDENHDTEKHLPNKTRLDNWIKPNKYFEEIEYSAWERGEMDL